MTNAPAKARLPATIIRYAAAEGTNSPVEILRRLLRNWVVPMTSVSAPSRASARPKRSEALVEATFMEASTSAPARSTTSPIEIRLTPVLTHESSVRSFARCSLISVPPCSCGSLRSLCGCKISDLLLAHTEDYTLEYPGDSSPPGFPPLGQSRLPVSGVACAPQKIENTSRHSGIR